MSAHFEPCACGCGDRVTTPDNWGRPVRYIVGHSRRGRGATRELLDLIRDRGPVRMAEIYDELGCSYTYSGLASLLGRMRDRGEVENVRRMGWALPGVEIPRPRSQSAEKIACDCGCGELRLRYDDRGKERRYVNGHKAKADRCAC